MTVTTETLDALFHAELSALDAFAARRDDEAGFGRLREDPDVRRILEAVAFFSARTRASATSATSAAVRRIAGGTIDDLLTTAPAAMMVQAQPKPGERLKAVSLPRGAPLRVVTSEERVGIFTITQPLELPPVAISRVGLVEARRRLSLRIELRAADELRKGAELAFYVRRLNDYRASLALLDAIAQSLERAFVTIGEGGAELPCSVAFGAPRAEAIEDERGEDGALAAIRAFFHLPEQDLFLRVTLPGGAVIKAETALTLVLELDETFPTDLSVSSDAFHLGVAPAVNLWSDLAEPITCDGTKDSYPIRSGSAVLRDVELHSVRGVYTLRGSARTPILPAALAHDGDAWELDEGEPGAAPALRLCVADAFEAPRRVQVDARWSQPELFAAPLGRLEITPQTRSLPGIALRLLGPLRPPSPSVLAQDPVRCLDLLSLRMRPVLRRRDLIGLLEVLGAGGDSSFRGLPALLDALEVAEAPDPARRAGGIKRVYRVVLRRKSPSDGPILRCFGARIAALLDAWTEDAVDVEVMTRADDPSRLLGKGVAP